MRWYISVRGGLGLLWSWLHTLQLRAPPRKRGHKTADVTSSSRRAGILWPRSARCSAFPSPPPSNLLGPRSVVRQPGCRKRRRSGSSLLSCTWSVSCHEPKHAGSRILKSVTFFKLNLREAIFRMKEHVLNTGWWLEPVPDKDPGTEPFTCGAVGRPVAPSFPTV